jgi:hypothetical protein
MKRAGSGGYSISVRIFLGGCTQRAERPMIRDSLRFAVNFAVIYPWMDL